MRQVLSNNNDKPVLVVGGGLGGLSVALALGRQGRSVRVLEQAPEIAPIGYGVQLGPNVFQAFERLGIAEEARKVCDLPLSLKMLDCDSGGTLLQVPLQSAEYGQRFQHPYVVVHRSDIHAVLLEACGRVPGVELTVGATFVDYEDHGSEGVTVRCEDGRSFHGAALIAADGIKSRARGLIVADGPPREIGYVAHRTMFKMEDLPKDLQHTRDVVLWAGDGYHIVHYALRGGSIFNVVAVFKDPSKGRGDRVVSHEEDVQNVYRNAQPALKQLLGRMDLERRWVLSDHDPILQWTKGRVTLLGDAAHPTLQSYAQGAGMAIEDAVSLAELLAEHGTDYEAAFREYPRRRLVRCARVQLGSRDLWRFYHAGGIEREVRNAELLERKERDYYDCLSWLWNGDPALTAARQAAR